MSATDQICVVTNMLGRLVGMQDQSFDIRCIEMKYAGLGMINPGHGMIVRHTLSFVMIVHAERSEDAIGQLARNNCSSS